MSNERIQRNGFDEDLTAEENALDERFVDAFAGMSRSAGRRGALSPAVRELVGLAVNAAVTHLHASAIDRHTRFALAAGASRREVLEVLQLASVLGIHTLTIGLPIVLDAFGFDREAPLDKRQNELKEEFIQRRGGWTELWHSVLLADEEFFSAYMEFSSVPWENEPVLEPKVREFIYVAIDASTTHLLEPGIQTHTKNAIENGATLEELLEVLELTSLIGIQTYVDGARSLIKAEFESKGNS
jgi:alkylhydroperoxidase/carboxymuconolactone decarboxylase family protein YurZ